MTEDLSSRYTPEFPLLIDNTMVKEFRKCERRFYHKHILGLVPSGGVGGEHVVAGAAYAAGLETFRKLYYGESWPFEEALIDAVIKLTEEMGDIEPALSYKSWDRMACALISYFDEFPPESDHIKPLMVDGEPCVEFTFSMELPISHPVTGDPILYGGKFDMIAQYGGEDGPLMVFDDKTTGQFSQQWVQGWELESQFSGYIVGAREWGYDVRSAIIRGAAIQKTQIKFLELDTQRPDYQLSRWYQQLLRDVETMKARWEEGYWDYDLGDACALFGGCPYLTLCTTQNPAQWAEGNYEVDRWVPVEMEP